MEPRRRPILHRAVAARLWRDDRGSELTEYALVAGLIAVIAVTFIAGYGTKVLARWTSVNASM